MLTFLPALIMLILSGPSSVDQIHVLGAIDAAPHRFAFQGGRASQNARARSTLTSLLAFSKDPRVIRAVAELLDSLNEQPPATPDAKSIEPDKEALSPPPDCRIQPGFSLSARSRDGPMA